MNVHILGALAIAGLMASCSEDRGEPSGTETGVHPAGYADRSSPDFHGTQLRWTRWAAMLDPADPDACGRCHDGAPTRPAGVIQSAPGAPACTKCHDQPGGVLACTTCHDYGNSNAHPAHLVSSAVRETPLVCSTCHPLPGSRVIGGLHGDGTVEVIFDARSVPGEASFDRATETCAVYCHDRGGRRARPKWSETAPVGCNDCHRSPPAGHYPGPCGNCHKEASADGSALSGGQLHLNGKIDLGDGSGKCGACHGSGDSPWPSTFAHPAHEAPTISEAVACDSCHVVPTSILDPTHLDGTVHVTLSGLAAARSSFPTWDGTSCADVACHGANLSDPAATPGWTDTSGAQSRCGACHGTPPSQHTPSIDCSRGDCHGSEIAQDVNGVPSITTGGLQLHVDGVVESNR